MDAQETRIYTAAFITIIVFGSIVIYFIISILQQQRKNLDLHKQIILAEINGIEKDRARIARDLHDEVGSLISWIKLKINVFELSDPEDECELRKINDYIDTLLQRIREISYDIMPTVLINSGVRNALSDYVNNISADDLAIHLDFPEAVNFSEQQSIHVYRIVQEIMHNTIKHSAASELYITFKIRENKIIILTKDNGTGFELKQNHSKGLGLKSLHSRAQLMNGKMFIESKPGCGTEYIFEIPAEL